MMNEARKFDITNQYSKYSTRSNGSEIISLVSKFLEITRKEWIMMNEARKIDFKNADYENRGSKTRNLRIVPEKSTEGSKDAAMTIEYLNEKLTFFYNNGGPIMEL